jgi:hypothetical protein
MLETIKKIINNPSKIIYGLERRGLMDWLNDEAYLKLIYRLTFRRRLNLKNAAAYTEKLAWYKLHWRNDLAKTCADKIAVRDYVKDKIGPEYLIECYGIWDSFDDIDFDTLPDAFVLKASNGTGDVVVCRNKAELDMKKAKAVLNKYSKRQIATKTREWVYYGLPHRILAERYIAGSDGMAIKDYKFFCFYGEPRLALVCSERDIGVKFDFFDPDWKHIPVSMEAGNNPDIEKPGHLDEMMKIAGILSADFPHVRVDLYDEGGRVYFGELTFFHAGGIKRFTPDEWDFKLGEFFDLGRIPAGQLV